MLFQSSFTPFIKSFSFAHYEWLMIIFLFTGCISLIMYDISFSIVQSKDFKRSWGITFLTPYFDIPIAVTEAGSVLSVLEKSVCIVSLCRSTILLFQSIKQEDLIPAP